MKKVICSLFALSALSTAVAQEVNIKILGTSDVHGRIVPWCALELWCGCR